MMTLVEGSDLTFTDRFKRIYHWGPTLALSIITTISLCTVNGILSWWPPLSSSMALLHMALYMLENVLVLYNFFSAAFVGPGHVPLGWKPENHSDIRYLQYCAFCEGYKAPRSHHCRKCNRCVMKMDHHCPWINNCVGHFNHATFTYFLWFAPVGCIHSLFVLIPAMYRALHRTQYVAYQVAGVPLVFMSVRTFLISLLACSLAVGVILAVGGLGVVQIRSILKNETAIESWIIEKAEYRKREEDEHPDAEFEFPYHLGRRENLRQVFSWDRQLLRDGIWWPVIDGCDQYTLTEEQMRQKREKQQRSVTYMARLTYGGAWFPVTHGPRTCCRPPFTDEPRIALSPGDRVVVTRWKKSWLYGDKLPAQADDTFRQRNGACSGEPELSKTIRVRGWFPRRCVVEMASDIPDDLPSADAKKKH